MYSRIKKGDYVTRGGRTGEVAWMPPGESHLHIARVKWEGGGQSTERLKNLRKLEDYARRNDYEAVQRHERFPSEIRSAL